MLAGLTAQRDKNEFWRQFWLQFFIWGAIDAALAAFGINGANRKEERLALGELTETDEQKEARNLWRILLINAVLDVTYVAGGVWVVQRFKTRADRRGMGAGIILQGLWLFLFDSWLAGEMGRRWLK